MISNCIYPCCRKECGNYNEHFDNNCEALTDCGEDQTNCDAFITYERSDELDRQMIVRYLKKNYKRSAEYFLEHTVQARINSKRPSKVRELQRLFYRSRNLL